MPKGMVSIPASVNEFLRDTLGEDNGDPLPFSLLLGSRRSGLPNDTEGLRDGLGDENEDKLGVDAEDGMVDPMGEEIGVCSEEMTGVLSSVDC